MSIEYEKIDRGWTKSEKELYSKGLMILIGIDLPMTSCVLLTYYDKNNGTLSC